MKAIRRYINQSWRFLKIHPRSAAAALVVVSIIVWTTPRFGSGGTVKIYDRKGVLLFEYAGNTGRNEPMDFARFPPALVNAVLASEDEHFWDHPGIDIAAMARSAVLDLRSGKIISGASTITQQVARLNTGPGSSFLPLRLIAKARQILIALRLSATYSKRDILTLYLNNVYLGNQNYGFGSAARFYFNKSVDRLSLGESAYLAGMIASPAQYDPYRHRRAGDSRQAYVLDRMQADRVVTADQRSGAEARLLVFARPDTVIKAPHFVDFVRQEMTKEGIPFANVSVYTTLDYDSYLLSQRIATDWVGRLKDINNVHNAAVLLLDNHSGAVITMLGGIDYFDSAQDGEVNLVTSPRQPGSAIKPITYTAAFMKGYTPATLIYDVKRSFITKKGEGFIPNNFGDTYHGLVLAREALASSYNLPAVDMLQKVGIDTFLTTARGLGITTFTKPEDYDYSITLGANEVSLLDLTTVYSSLARGGRYIKPYAIDRVLNSSGTVIYRHEAQHPEARLGEKAEQAAYLVTDILSDPEARMPGFGEKNYLTLSRPAAVKTGTTTDWHDIWTVGYTPSYTVGVWMGNNDNDAMRKISSATGAAPLWNQFFEEYLKDKPIELFSRPPGIVERQICATDGNIPDGLCPLRKEEKFIVGTEPKSLTNIYKLVNIDSRNGLLAGSACPASSTERRAFIDYPPQVYSWAVAAGKPVIPTDRSPLCGGSIAGVSRSADSIEITNPKNQAIFQNAPELIRHQGIPLQANVSKRIGTVSWYVDGQLFAGSHEFPFTVIYPLKPGTHIVYAKGTADGDTIVSKAVTFQIVDK